VYGHPNAGSVLLSSAVWVIYREKLFPGFATANTFVPVVLKYLVSDSIAVALRLLKPFLTVLIIALTIVRRFLCRPRSQSLGRAVLTRGIHSELASALFVKLQNRFGFVAGGTLLFERVVCHLLWKVHRVHEKQQAALFRKSDHMVVLLDLEQVVA